MAPVAMVLLLLGWVACNACAVVVCDSTLRLDYVFDGAPGREHVSLAALHRSAGWHGRRHNMDRLFVDGNGDVTVTDAATGDTLYRDAFSSLYQEWLTTGDTVDRAFEHVVTVPMPAREAVVTLSLRDARHRTVATHSCTVNPRDILIRPGRADSPYMTKVLHRASHPTPINVAIVAEGYTKAQDSLFFADAAAATEAILEHGPFGNWAHAFNFTAVHVPSRDEGVSVPGQNCWRSTPFGSHFSTFYSDRYLTLPGVFALHDALEGIPAHHIIVLANTDAYGGGGIYNAYTLTTTHHANFRPVVVHEWGHSFAGLADEYFYDDDVMTDTYPLDLEPWEQNITTLVDFVGHKWQPLIDDGVVSSPTLVEGGGYSARGIWRPATDCRMRTNTAAGFCAGCMHAITQYIRYLTGECSEEAFKDVERAQGRSQHLVQPQVVDGAAHNP